MDTARLISDVELAFPFIAKPGGSSLSFHGDECVSCSLLQADLRDFNDAELPLEALITVHQEMSCLSAEGWCWVLPSYLRLCIAGPPVYGYGDLLTEFLIYNLSPELEYRADVMRRLVAFNREQIACLRHFIEWCGSHPHWANYCAKEISSALDFIGSLCIAPDQD